MDIINQVIGSLTIEEIRYFKIFAKRMDTSSERKDLMLFDYIRHSDEKYDEAKIARKLYGDNNMDPFYRLKNRLMNYLGDYLTFHHLWRNDGSELNRHLSLFDIFQRKGQFKVAHFYLKKAEHKARTAEYFEMLDAIYGNFVKLSAELHEINPEEYIAKRKENAGRLNQVREADQAIAALSYRLKVTQNLSPGKTDTLRILNKTIREFTTDETLKMSRSFQTRIYRAVSQILLQQHDYLSMEPFLKKTYAFFESQDWFDRENHEVKLQMLTYLVNSLFRNDNFPESLKYAGTLGSAIHEFDNLLYDKYLFFYYNSLVINYSAIDIKKALGTLEEFETETRNRKNSYYDQFIFFNKAMLLHQSGKPAEAIRNIVKLYVNDNYKKADNSFKLKISIAELIMHFDSGDIDSYELRSRGIKQEFKKLLSTGVFGRDKEMIGLMDKMILRPSYYKRDMKLKKRVDAFVQSKIDAMTLEAEIIKYTPWLSSKWGLKIGS
jgi:hypothetical protein